MAAIDRDPSSMSTRSILRREWKALAAIVVLTMLATGAEAGFLVIIARTGLALSNGESFMRLTADIDLSVEVALLAAGGLIGLRLLANVSNAWITARAKTGAIVRMRDELAGAYLDTEWALKHGLAPGRLQQLLVNYTHTAITVLPATARALTSGVSLTALITIALFLQPSITVISIVMMGGLAIPMIPLRRVVRRRSERAAEARLGYATTVNEMEALALEIEALGVSAEQAATARVAAVEAAETGERGEFAQLLVGPTYQFVAYGSVIALLGIGLATGVDDIATVSAVLVLLLRALTYGQAFQQARATLTNGDVYTRALVDELTTFHGHRRHRGDAVGDPEHGVVAQQLSFAYDDAPTLVDVGFTIDAGETVGVVGPSGSGKSTLTQLLLGLRGARGGLTVAGVAPIDADPAWWRRTVAYVPQRAELLSGTVAENVRFLRPEISDADIEWACRTAAIHDDIMALPDGYDTELGSRGGRLSGGQQQRLGIARALAGRPSLVVLDEPSSALDHDTEERIVASLGELDDMTLVIITHRLAVLGVCDRVFEMTDGVLADLGDPAAAAARLP